MGVVYSTYRGVERYVQGFGGETWEKKPLGRLRTKWKYNIKTDLQEVGMDWVHLAQDRDRLRALVNVLVNLRVP